MRVHGTASKNTVCFKRFSLFRSLGPLRSISGVTDLSNSAVTVTTVNLFGPICDIIKSAVVSYLKCVLSLHRKTKYFCVFAKAFWSHGWRQGALRPGINPTTSLREAAKTFLRGHFLRGNFFRASKKVLFS